LIYKLDRTRYARYDPEIHGEFEPGGVPVGVDEDETIDDESRSESITAEQAEFALELHLEDFMEANWDQIQFGRSLRIWRDPDGLSGRQYQTDIGAIDFLCEDQDSGAFVVIELKRGKSSDSVLGQAQRYMGWVNHNLAADEQEVHGLIIASHIDEKLKYGLEVAGGISARRYSVEFTLHEPEPFLAT
jgi:restriction system protein